MHNLAYKSAYQKRVRRNRKYLTEWMKETKDNSTVPLSII